MDNLSSSDLDSPSKTPLFIAIAAILIGLAGLGLGWMGFSRANALEQKVAALESANGQAAELEESVSATARRVDQVVGNMTSLSQNVSDALSEVSSDVSKMKSDIRKVAIDAGTARKMAEELEKKGLRVASTPAPSSSQPDSSASSSEAAKSSTASPSSSSPSKAPDATPGESGVYTIKSGDTLGRIAAAYNVTLSELQEANPGVDPRRLRIGQQIVVPANQ